MFILSLNYRFNKTNLSFNNLKKKSILSEGCNMFSCFHLKNKNRKLKYHADRKLLK